LRTFDSTFFQVPGRMNVFSEHPFKVLFDYGHNAHAVGMMADLARRLDVTGRRIVVLAGPGDRRDEDLVAIANAVAGRFDHYICRRDDNLRDRAPDEVPRIQAHALRAAGVPDGAISIIPDEQEAIESALCMGGPGDLLLIFADALVRSWKQITKFNPGGGPSLSSASHSTAPLAPSPPTAGETGGNSAGAGVHGGLGAPAGAVPDFNLEGLIRDERGIRMAPESDD
jgi:cyanophycin synthetase